MTTPAPDDFLLRHAPRKPQPVDPALLAARQDLNDALASLRSVPDLALDDTWTWREHELELRYGFYRQYEAVEEARAGLGPVLAQAQSLESPARPLVAAATAARWELHGLLAGLSDDELDLDPGNGEWTVRQTLAHIVGTQRGYGWFTCWWLAQAGLDSDAFPTRVPDELGDLMPSDEQEGEGSLADIRRRLDDILDLSSGALGGLDEAGLGQQARWSGVPVTIGFRLGRWSSHIREHTIQVEKTLGMHGRPLREVDRLLRLIGGAYGRLEEALYLWPPEAKSVSQACAQAAMLLQGVARDSAGLRSM